jgi:hypothetical protein
MNDQKPENEAAVGQSALTDGLGTDALRAFAQEVMECWPMGGIDGGELQDIAEKHGLLRPETRYAPCREEGCTCAEYVNAQEFEQGVTCYRKTALLLVPNVEVTGAARLYRAASVLTAGLCGSSSTQR